MKVFGMKQRELTDEDRVAIARLSAVAARFKGDQSTVLTDFTESSPDPLGELELSEEVPLAQAEASEEPEASGESKKPDAAE